MEDYNNEIIILHDLMLNKLVKEIKVIQETYFTNPHEKLLRTICSECIKIIESKNMSEIVLFKFSF